jgi:magnesium chelatase family protein
MIKRRVQLVINDLATSANNNSLGQNPQENRGLSTNFQLISAMNPCPCGFYGDSQKPCTCAHALVTKYQKRIAGPLLDRIDIHIEVPRVDYEKLSGDRMRKPSECIRARVQAARDIQQARCAKIEASDIVCNADMRVGEIRQFCKLPEEGQSLMRAATLCCV